MQRLDDLLADAARASARSAIALGLLDRLQAEQHRRQLLPGLVVELARQPPALELLRLDDATERVARDARRQVDSHRGARREGLGEAQVAVAEARVFALLVVGDDDADRPRAGDERDVEAGQSVNGTRRVLVDLGIVLKRVDALGTSALEHEAALRSRPARAEDR